MKVKAKTVYETSDGKTFPTKLLAERHEKAEKVFSEAYEEHAVYGKFEFHDADEFSEFVIKFARKII